MKNKYIHYLKSFRKPIDPYTFLLEAGQGKNINGNMFAILKVLCESKEWNAYSVFFVVSDDTIVSAKKRLAFYGYNQVRLVIRESLEYQTLLATCKFLITDNSFPPYYIKKRDQIMLNTWHGTPLKRLGRSDIENSRSISNVQKNFVMSDYILFPNEYTRDIFMEDYSLKNILKNQVLLMDYPRNASFYNDKLKEDIIQKYHLQNKKCYAYMPTWRGSNRNANTVIQKETTIRYLQKIDEKLSEEEILFVNLHFLIGNDLDLSTFQHIQRFPEEYETYDFLNICDVLITDYSSVFFDYAVSKRKIILFTYDLEDYLTEKGTYFPIQDLPFPMVDNVDDLMKELHQVDFQAYDSFIDRFCAYSSPKSVDDLLHFLVYHDKTDIVLEDPYYNGKKNVFIHIDKIPTRHHERFALNYLSTLNDDVNYIILFNGSMNGYLIDFIKNIPMRFQIYGYVAKNSFLPIEKVLLYFYNRFKVGEVFSPVVLKAIRREFYRKFGLLRMDEFVNLLDSSQNVSKFFYQADINKTYVKIPKVYYGLTTLKKWFRLNQKMQNEKAEQHLSISDFTVDEETKGTLYNSSVAFLKLKIHSLYVDSALKVKLSICTKSLFPLDFKNIKLFVGEEEVPFSVKKEMKGKTYSNLSFYQIELMLSKEQLLEMPIQNKIFFQFSNQIGYGFQKGIRYCLFKKNIHYAHSSIHKINDQISCYLRQTKANTLYLTVRPTNKTDSVFENFKLGMAYYLAKIFSYYYRPILLFEKDSARYEESASIVYERLIDLGYRNVYFILDKDYSGRKDIATQYQKNILDKYSFKHYLYFFMSKTFIGSEALIHVLELRACNRHVLKHVNALDVDYVFLQHGVMYMISLDSESRKFFRPRSSKGKGKYRVVTSSRIEADHFINLGHHLPEQVIICGLPKFDKNEWDQNADKIVIMPTWRPWEYNEINTSFIDTKYYRMLERIYRAIPSKYQSQVIILPHPLVYQAAQNCDFDLKSKMLFDVKYDDILKYTKLLITDYSSIAYDAFYRGSNVIFYWEELAECLEAYGPTTKLMLNKENCFGDICYDSKQLEEAIAENYLHPQKRLYLDRYNQLVEFHDGKNTERLINRLKEERII